MESIDSHDGQDQTTITPSLAQAQTGAVVGPVTGVFVPGDIVGDSYQVINQLGHGAMGMVYRVKHVTMYSEYALKVLTTDQLNEQAVLRFQNEAQAIAKLNHQNIVAIYNFGLHDGRLPFYVMDLLHGESMLEKLDQHGPMPAQLALQIFIEICSGLSYAHRKGILHRDIKPANFVMLDTPDVRGAHVKVVDFGIVKFAEELKPDIQKLTAVGQVCGSPSYMSPEQSSGKKIDPRSDIYSLGCSLFQALTGKVPFHGRNSSETLMMHHEKPAPTLASKCEDMKFSRDLESLVAKMIAKAPMDRYQNMDAVAQDMRNILDRKSLGTLSTSQSPGVATGQFDSSIALRNTLQIKSSDTTSGASSVKQTNKINRSGITDATRGTAKEAKLDWSSATRADFDSRGKSGLGSEGLEDAPETRTNPAKIVAVSLLSLLLMAVVGFFAWQALQPPMPVSEMANPHSSAPKVSPSSEGSNNQFYSKIISEGGKEFIEFDFPDDNNTTTSLMESGPGVIGLSMSSAHAMQGKVRFPKGLPIYILPSRSTLKQAHFFEKFRPGEIAGIFVNQGNGTDEVLISAARIGGISRIFMADCPELTSSIIPVVGNLKLTVFLAPRTSINGQLLARMHFWQDLHFLDLAACKGVSPILNQLKDSSNLEMLNISSTKLSHTDFQTIDTMHNLDYLNLAYDELTAEDLRSLSSLSKLKDLDIFGCRLKNVSLAADVRHFPTLTNLHVTKGVLTPKELRELQREHPGLKVKEEVFDPQEMLARTMHRGGEHGWHREHGAWGRGDDEVDPIMMRVMPQERDSARRMMAPMWHHDRHGAGGMGMKHMNIDDDDDDDRRRTPSSAHEGDE